MSSQGNHTRPRKATSKDNTVDREYIDYNHQKRDIVMHIYIWKAKLSYNSIKLGIKGSMIKDKSYNHYALIVK